MKPKKESKSLDSEKKLFLLNTKAKRIRRHSQYLDGRSTEIITLINIIESESFNEKKSKGGSLLAWLRLQSAKKKLKGLKEEAKIIREMRMDLLRALRDVVAETISLQTP